MLMYRDPNDRSAAKRPPFRTPADVLNRTDVTPGFVQESSVQKFFETTREPIYRRLYERMQRTLTAPSPYAPTVQEGVNVLREYKGKYVLFVDSNMADYYAGAWPCDLVMSGDVKRQGFALAFPKGSPIRPQFDAALQRLNENGKLAELVKKWWPKTCTAKYTWASPPQTVGVAVEAVAESNMSTGAMSNRFTALGGVVAMLICIVASLVIR